MPDVPIDPGTNTAGPDFEWIFGYGSLMWRPGFRFLEQCPARLDGYHRTPCIYSLHHRGTVAVPGLVLCLDKGGFCHGIAFKIDMNDKPKIIDYLHENNIDIRDVGTDFPMTGPFKHLDLSDNLTAFPDKNF